MTYSYRSWPMLTPTRSVSEGQNELPRLRFGLVCFSNDSLNLARVEFHVGTGTRFSTSAMASTFETPAYLLCEVKITRCGKTYGANSCTSSGST